MLKLRNTFFKHADGGYGWPEKGPFDGIISCAAPESIPQELIDQLAEGGRLVSPVGDSENQSLHLIEKTADGISHKIVESAYFVPLKSGVIQ